MCCKRFEFRQTKILPNESIHDFNARLNVLSKHCSFDMAHLDQIILNASSKLREKLLLEKQLTLEKALEIAKYTAEGGKWMNQFIEAGSSISPEVRVKQEVNYSKQLSNFGSNIKFKNKSCYRCGSKHHLANDKNCPALKVKCHKCDVTGHFSNIVNLKSEPESPMSQNTTQFSPNQTTLWKIDTKGDVNVR